MAGPATHARLTITAAVTLFGVAACAIVASAGETNGIDLRSVLPANPFASIPAQCYTRTEDASGTVHNPCYTCHVTRAAPNYVRDSALQLAYDFPGPAATNPWTNLFVDRSAAVAAIPDAEILSHVRADNYRDAAGRIRLAARLDALPSGWDINGDGRWSGYRPDIRFDFDADGYDRDESGERNGWRAYGYYPLAGSFLPANGSADDVAIRLPQAFRKDIEGRTDWTVYAVNLAIVEALIKRMDVAIDPTDEAAIGLDLDRDGRMGRADHIAFAFDPRNGITMRYAGLAGSELDAGRLHLAAGLYPEGTEFVHSLRYLDVDAEGRVVAAPRMKELRYARKVEWRSYGALLDKAMNDLREANDNPDRPDRFFGDVESGIANGQGWRYQGFIEDAGGQLRPQTFEESMTCAGCHGGVGRTTDGTFSLARKVDGPRAWYHWDGERRLADLPDHAPADGSGSYADYLHANHAGDEYRANGEIIARFFPGGRADEDAIARLKAHVGALTEPSPARALALDKAYRLIVQEQSFTRGRTPVIAPLDETVWRSVKPGQPTGIDTPTE